MKKLKISFYLNIFIFILVLIATIIMLTGFQFMGEDLVLTATKIEAFKFFTVDSNVLMGITAIIFALYEHKYIKNKEKIPTFMYVLKLVSTTAVVLTFLTTTFYLAPFVPSGFFSMFINSNLFFHFIIPLLSLVTFMFFENTNVIKFKYTFLGIIPTFLYAIFYLINVLLHIENDKVSYTYDWYGFAQGGTNTIVFTFSFMLIITYVICAIIWLFNKKISK